MIATHKTTHKLSRDLLLWVGGTLLVGGISALLGGDYRVYQELQPPPLAPPSWLFFPVWTLLYLAMGTAALQIARSGDIDRGHALHLYLAQLAVCALWPLFFFRLEMRVFAFFVVLLLLALAALTVRAFCRHVPLAGWLLLPYMAWLLFAAYLNLGFAIRNG